MRDAVNLDFLRSVAVLLVVHAHWTVYTGRAGQDGWSGITGVCMFFVHTSLVLMWSLERDPRVGHFYVRRAFRLYPLWLVVLAIVLLFHLPQSPEFHFRMPGLREILFNAALLCNLRFGPNLVGASWTLPIEVQMYLFLPFLFFFARATRALWPLLVIDLFVMFYDRTNFPSFYSALPMCIPYFLPGIMGFVLSKRGGLKVLPGWAFPIFLFLIVLFDRYDLAPAKRRS
jgi:peptidoglycan/LPS O-acetylase OafA/YrhL